MIKLVMDYRQWLLASTCFTLPSFLYDISASKAVVKELHKEEARQSQLRKERTAPIRLAPTKARC